MLNIGRMGPTSADYYLAAVAQVQIDYYHGHGEAPGRWLGSGLDGLELEFGLEVTGQALGRVLDGDHPVSGERVARHPARQVPGFDLTFRAPKSVSLLWGLGDEEVAGQVQQAHDAAVTATLGYLEQHVARSRRGAGGVEQYRLRWDITDPHHTLGDQPTDPLQRADYLQTALTVSRHLRKIEQTREVEQHLEIDGPDLGLNIGLSR